MKIETLTPKEDNPIIYSDVLKAEDLISDNDRINSVNHCVILIVINKVLDDKQKLLIVIVALRMGYREIDPTSVRHCILQAARRKIHYTCGLPEPGCNLRRIEIHIRFYLKAEAYGEEDLLPTNNTRNRKLKIQKFLICINNFFTKFGETQ